MFVQETFLSGCDLRNRQIEGLMFRESWGAKLDRVDGMDGKKELLADQNTNAKNHSSFIH